MILASKKTFYSRLLLESLLLSEGLLLMPIKQVTHVLSICSSVGNKIIWKTLCRDICQVVTID